MDGKETVIAALSIALLLGSITSCGPSMEKSAIEISDEGISMTTFVQTRRNRNDTERKEEGQSTEKKTQEKKYSNEYFHFVMEEDWLMLEDSGLEENGGFRYVFYPKTAERTPDVFFSIVYDKSRKMESVLGMYEERQMFPEEDEEIDLPPVWSNTTIGAEAYPAFRVEYTNSINAGNCWEDNQNVIYYLQGNEGILELNMEGDLNDLRMEQLEEGLKTLTFEKYVIGNTDKEDFVKEE